MPCAGITGGDGDCAVRAGIGCGAGDSRGRGGRGAGHVVGLRGVQSDPALVFVSTGEVNDSEATGSDRLHRKLSTIPNG